MNDLQNIASTINAENPLILIQTLEEEYAIETVRSAALSLKRDLQIWSAGYGVRTGYLEDEPAEVDTEEAVTGLCHFATAQNNPVCVALDMIPHLKKDLNLRIFRDCLKKITKRRGTLILIDSTQDIPHVIKDYAKTVPLSLPDEKEIEDILVYTLRRIHRKKPIEMGFSKKGIKAVIRNLRGLNRRQIELLIREAVVDDRKFDEEDINNILAGKRKMLQKGGLLQFIQTPLTLNEIGGMTNLKQWLKQRKNIFSEDRNAYGLTPPKGVLMLGVQGAGKSLCAKAVATAWQLPLLRMDPGALFSKYIGESEANLHTALEQVEQMSPSILWIDEIEKAFASAAAQSSDGGLSKRMFGTLLTWMQDHEEPVFIIATANDIEALPPELLRKGRFDEIFFVGLPKTGVRKIIFKIHLKKRSQDPAQFDLNELARASEGFSGAEIEQAIIASLYKAYADKRKMTQEDILETLRTSPPLSVTMREKIEALYRWAEGRCVPAD